ncbi:MAG TPA: hypothetical protein VI815_02290 [Candidatus Nanoarchaeia archaeon]|nr:hypothetical protein [Candidatus Nanoarchaeia archaeon]
MKIVEDKQENGVGLFLAILSGIFWLLGWAWYLNNESFNFIF